MERQFAQHSFPPVIHPDSEILILGSFPSVQSRKDSFFYMHPQNRFWKVLEAIFQDPFTTLDIEEKKRLLEKHKIALYDVIESCFINGSSDQSIEIVEYANIEAIVHNSSIKNIYVNGQKAWRLFQKRFENYLSISEVLPSTSPANAQCDFACLLQSWQKILNKTTPTSEDLQ